LSRFWLGDKIYTSIQTYVYASVPKKLAQILSVYKKKSLAARAPPWTGPGPAGGSSGCSRPPSRTSCLCCLHPTICAFSARPRLWSPYNELFNPLNPTGLETGLPETHIYPKGQYTGQYYSGAQRVKISMRGRQGLQSRMARVVRVQRVNKYITVVMVLRQKQLTLQNKLTKYAINTQHYLDIVSIAHYILLLYY